MSMRRNAYSRGVAAITTMLGLGLVVAVAGVGMGLISFFESTIAFSHAKSQEAFLMAQGGIGDGLLRLARDKNFLSAGYPTSIGANNATTTVENIGGGKRRITSTGSASKRNRRIRVEAAVDDVTGAITVISWKEISL